MFACCLFDACRFVPEDFWFLELTLRIPTNNDGNDNNFDSINHSNQGGNANRPISFTWKRQRLFDRTFTLNLYESCIDDGTAVVTNLSGREKRKWRPVPLATVELQKRASRYLRIGSEALMTAAEALYNEGKFLQKCVLLVCLSLPSSPHYNI